MLWSNNIVHKTAKVVEVYILSEGAVNQYSGGGSVGPKGKLGDSTWWMHCNGRSQQR